MTQVPSAPYFLARSAIALFGALIGYLTAEALITIGVLAGSINLAYLTILGLLLGYLAGGPFARYVATTWERAFTRVARIPPDAVLAAGIGATVALVVTVLLNSVLEQVPGFTWYLSLIITLILVTASAWFFVVNRNFLANRLAGTRAPPENATAPRSGLKVVDTSAIIDGRLLDVIQANFIDGKLLIPQFILAEMQRIADADDPLKRKRGRRGLEILDQLASQRTLPTQVVDTDFADAKEVDAKLIKLCANKNADLITTDYNLNRIASLQGIRVLNVNQLANAVKAMFLPGERLTLSIVREGREPGQGLAYLEDGTMIVVEDAAHLVGNTVETLVTSNLQTNMGRMIFARLTNETTHHDGQATP